MKKLFACLLIIGATGMASAQVSNFTGFSGAVNLSSVSSRTKSLHYCNLVVITGVDLYKPLMD